MLGPLDQDNLRDYLTALADGELEPPQRLAVWTHLAEHPDRAAALRWLADQQRLTQAARKTLLVPAPDDLRARITALVAATPVDTTAETARDESAAASPMSIATARPAAARPATAAGRSWLGRAGYPLAAAALLALAVTLIDRPGPTPPASAASPVVPAAMVTQVSHIHGECARLPEALHDAKFEAADPALAALVKADLNGPTAAPDLSPVGYHFVGAGPCPIGESGAVHLLYRGNTPGSMAAVSVFAKPDTGEFAKLQIGRVYRVSSPTSPFPALAWRTGRAVYFLLADDDRTEAAALQAIKPTPVADIVNAAGQ